MSTSYQSALAVCLKALASGPWPIFFLNILCYQRRKIKCRYSIEIYHRR